jgi:hypothetical protein
VEYGGYLFSVLDQAIVKIPVSEDKINDNARSVMEFPDEDGDGEPGIFCGTSLFVNDGALYINIADYMAHGGLYRMTSADGKPELVIEGGGISGMLSFSDSNLHPKEMKFLSFSDGDAGKFWGKLYYYFPRENVAKKLTEFAGYMLVGDFLGTTKDDGVLTARLQKESDSPWDITGVTGIDKLTMNVETKAIKRSTLLEGSRMPKAYAIFFNSDDEKLYLFGTGFWIYDIRKDSLKRLVNFKKYIPNWPDDIFPYVTLGESEATFFIHVDENRERDGKFCASGDKRAVLIDTIKETYEVTDNFDRGEDGWLLP